MILHALKEYYDRKASDPESEIAPEGFERKVLEFIILIDQDGRFIQLLDTRETVGKRLIGKRFLLPKSISRSGSKSYATTFLLWDHAGYLLRHSKDVPKEKEKARNQHQTWLDSLKSLPVSLRESVAVQAIERFYFNNGIEAVKASSNWPECAKLPSANMAFQLVGEEAPVPCSHAVAEYVRQTQTVVQTEGEIVGRCLLSGAVGPIARTHSDTRIGKDAKKLVGFQKNSGYDSYGKEQGYNAPISQSAEFAYTTALNTLLANKRQRILVGDAVTVFWAAKPDDEEFEESFASLFSEPSKDGNPDEGVQAVESLFRAVQTGALSTDGDHRFYVLGLAPNAARISVRFWICDTVARIGERIARHFKDTRICHGPRDRDALSLFRLLVSIAGQGKAENIPPNLGGEVMRAILEGLPYPQTLLQGAIRRIHAEREVTYPRAAVIKACINRQTNTEDLHVSLDESNTNIGYRLGRLFAVLEKVQSDANPGINATIRDRFYGAASGTPVTVFGNLMRLKNHHLAKLPEGMRITRERLITEIMGGIVDFPSHLDLADQGRFAIGYYHQVQQFYI